MEHPILCALCGHPATCSYKGMKGYIEGTAYDIYECPTCRSSFVWPLETDESIYNFIYNQAEKISGYTRYYRYAQAVKKARKPLQLLANSENVYWGIKEALTRFFPEKEKISILEIGSGLGYLTYSLNKEGYATTGVDLSREAVEKAKANYGDYYEAGDIFDIAQARQKHYDCVIMTEMIEHVEDPKKFIHAALSLLNDNGKLLLTTPNKNASPKGTIWQSDVPPVHLWWLSEESIALIAQEANKQCTFIDFLPYTKKYFEYGVSSSMEDIQSSLPRLNKDGSIPEGKEVSTLKMRIFGPLLHTHISNMLRRMKPKTPSHRSSSMCAVLG
jgi:2-polyprenyl-3-methyl-5-hydroxy-6-metoxy-1,4-benzoquinol methylase